MLSSAKIFPIESRRDRSGFALIITIVLVAFLVLILVGLATFSRVETTVSGNAQDLAAARQNALLGLNVALGDLQKYAGLDRAVTATAEHFSAAPHNQKRFYTGVWNTQSSSFERWLVSDQTPAPGSAPAAVGLNDGQSVLLVGANTLGSAALTDFFVYAERRDVESANIPGFPAADSREIGQYAYWVSDEGVKLNLALSSKVGDLGFTPANTFFDTQQDRDRASQRYAHRAGLETFAEFSLQPETDVASLARWNALDKVVSLPQAQFGTALGVDATAQNYLQAHYHDFTVSSFGVLADTKTGKLRENWSNQTGASLPDGWRDYMNFRPDTSVAAALPQIRLADANTTSAYYPIRPLFTELAVDVVPYRRAADELLVVRMRISLEIANPYALPIYHDAGSANDNGYIVDLGDLPEITVTPEGGSGLSVNLQTLFDASETATGRWRLPITNLLNPGEVRVIELERTLETPHTITDASADATGDQLSYASVGVGPYALDVRIEWPGDVMNALSIYENIPFGTFTRGLQPWAGSDFTSDGFSFHASVNQLLENWDELTHDASDPAIAKSVDLRWKTLDFSDTDFSSYFDNSAGDFTTPPSPRVLAQNTQFRAGDFFRASVIIPQIYDVPTGPATPVGLFSVGELAHMPMPQDAGGFVSARRPAFALGRRVEAGNSNSFFDRATFVPVNAEWNYGELLPNTRYQPVLHGKFGTPTLAEMQGQEAALFLLAKGAFNVNSTSIPAWRGVLARSLVDWVDWQGVGLNGDTTSPFPPIRNPINSRPQTAHYSTNDAANDRFPMRLLTDTEVDDLATEIVTQIRARTNPFYSLEEFFTSTVLETAINDAGLNPAATPPAQKGGEKWVTPERLAMALAPYLAARSDTFVVRAYGASKNPVTQAIEGQAWLEAVVQRTPERTTPVAGTTRSDEYAEGPATEFGRRFKIVSLRWLSPSDI